MSAKEYLTELLQTLPDDATLEDIEYHIYVQKRIERGIEAANRGETISHEEAVKRLEKWRLK